MRTDQIQSLVFTGFGGLKAASILLVEAAKDQQEETKLALGRIAERISFGKPKQRLTEVTQIAFTVRGLERIGLSKSAIDSFPLALREKMENSHRLRVLGDEDENAPKNWHWSGDTIDAALFLYAENANALARLETQIASDLNPGFTVVKSLPTLLLDDGREHFGFRDGLSQPVIRELNPQAAKEDAIAAGELVLGYSDETGEEPLSPKDGDVDIGRDGTFVVLRQLEQDVPGFWKALRERAEDDAGAVWLAAKMVGRWPDGAPVGTEGPNNPPSAPYAPPSYANDPYGLACPRGAHIRRANPRDGFDADPEISLKKVRRHRLLRRGRPYGAPAPPETYPQGVTVTARDVPPDTPNDKRGIYFVCLCADLARQFELVQQSWLNNAKHDGMYDEVCPIAAGRGLHADARRFTLPQHPIRRRLHELPQFVTVRGSAYLFLPGRNAIQHFIE